MSKKPGKRTSEAGTANPGVSLREAAAGLGVSRAKLLRYVREGLPVTRKSERVAIDLNEARAWLALNEGDAEPKVLQLHPDDPRHAERRAVARLAWLKLATKAGHMIRLDDVDERVSNEWLLLRSVLLGLPKYFG